MVLAVAVLSFLLSFCKIEILVFDNISQLFLLIDFVVYLIFQSHQWRVFLVPQSDFIASQTNALNGSDKVI